MNDRFFPSLVSGSGHLETKCIYAFTNPFYPSFPLPPAQPNSPGDVQLNKNNPIRLANGSLLAAGQGCNSVLFSYYHEASEQFLSTYSDVNEQTSEIGDLIYATHHDQLYARTIQSSQANLGAFLGGKRLKIDLICNNGLAGCALFTVVDQFDNSSLSTTIRANSRATFPVLAQMIFFFVFIGVLTL